MGGENGEPTADDTPDRATINPKGGSTRGDGTPRRHRVSSDEVSRRIDLLAKRMSEGATDRQLCKEFAEQWGICRKTLLTHYASHAREVFRKRANLSRIQAKGRSLEFWAGRLGRYLKQEKEMEERLVELSNREDELHAKIDQCDDDELRDALTQQLNLCTRSISRTNTALIAMRHNIHAMGDRADRIYGTLAPLKIAETNSHGDDRPRTQAEILTELTRLGMIIPDMPLPPGLEHSHAIPADFERVDLPADSRVR